MVEGRRGNRSLAPGLELCAYALEKATLGVLAIRISSPFPLVFGDFLSLNYEVASPPSF